MKLWIWIILAAAVGSLITWAVMSNQAKKAAIGGAVAGAALANAGS